MEITVEIYYNTGHNFTEFDPAKDLIEFVAAEVVDCPTTSLDGLRQVAEQIYAGWNAGSDQESEKFLSSKCRSLSVGDVLVFPEIETSLACAPLGWSVVSPDPDFMFRRVA